MALSALLSGKALDIISKLTVEQVKDYDIVKASLLKGYDLTEEGYRMKFRQSKLHQGETFVQYAARIEKYLDRWVDLCPYEDNFEGLKSLLIQEQVFDICSKDLLMFVNPILTGGGQFDPPLHEIRDCLATAADRDTPFHDFFLSSLAHLLIPSLRKSDRRSRGHATFCTRTSAQNLPKICILHRFVYKTHGNY